MTPAGIERNKQIAEMRGDKLKDHTVRCGMCGRDPYLAEHKRLKEKACCREHQRYVEFDVPPEPYSTDISCAMELELPCNKYHEITHKMSEGFFTEIWHQSNLVFTSGVHKNEAESKADARSGAWLLWQEGK